MKIAHKGCYFDVALDIPSVSGRCGQLIVSPHRQLCRYHNLLTAVELSKYLHTIATSFYSICSSNYFFLLALSNQNIRQYLAWPPVSLYFSDHSVHVVRLPLAFVSCCPC